MKKVRALRHAGSARPAGVVVLAWEHRQKHRFVARLEDGQELFVQLPRGTLLADGDVLEAEDGEGILVRAADEELSVAEATDPLLLTRVAYHLGNRHVALQIEPSRVSYLHDHVLDDLARRLGAVVTFQEGPFHPEAGAYGGHSHAHSHGHSHDHSHEHAHGHSHDHSPAPSPKGS